ncbi:septal ring lytic transglycosylase RlpA family protein [Lacimicrobium sp. SS2-24]|uniref:septal ring lytic transglycosylase RlpA family protein n=1 Tax=Lacimicrobium sp. SS2-24 TaxID=2005569 RepID=UPI000B4B82A5|nr:septal ring lytic transglycosylase RlpA family protein [Lacimicrobium sp. SS2-24]
MKLLISLLILTLSGCATQQGRYSQRNDSAPARPPAEISLRDAEPVHVPFTPRGNAPYEVFGRAYQPMRTAQDYSQRGEASWYGQKFHGHLTSNGEVYDMYAMSAAHKTLPLPSFVRVTNLANNKQVIVRVNDRGPFHGNRVIDLSYAAAVKLDMLKTGTAKVQIDSIHVDEQGNMRIAGESPLRPEQQEAAKALFIQVAALSDENKVKQLAKGLENLYQLPTQLLAFNGVYRLRLGPIEDKNAASLLVEELKRSGYQGAYQLYAPH